jgi:hypothetical protein
LEEDAATSGVSNAMEIAAEKENHEGARECRRRREKKKKRKQVQRCAQRKRKGQKGYDASFLSSTLFVINK